MATLRSDLILAIKGGEAGLAVEFHRTGLRFSRLVDLKVLNIFFFRSASNRLN
jgi:hypothetical protein